MAGSSTQVDSGVSAMGATPLLPRMQASWSREAPARPA